MKNRKRLPTKSKNIRSYVTKKGKVVSSYTRKQHYNPDKERFRIKDDDIIDFLPVDSGVTEGTAQLTTGKTDYYYKPLDGEKFYDDGMRARMSIVLRDRKTDKILNFKDTENSIINEDYDNVKGQLADREDMTYKLAEHIKADHIPPVEIKKIYGKLGVVSKSVYNHFDKKYDKIIPYSNQDKEGDTKKFKTFTHAVASDKNIADKVQFDYLIGNTDRHANNLFLGQNKKGEYEIIGIDHGYTFPYNNETYVKVDIYKQQPFNKLAKGKPPSKEFISNLRNFRNSSKFNDYVSELKDRIGSDEANAFIERVDNILTKFV